MYVQGKLDVSTEVKSSLEKGNVTFLPCTIRDQALAVSEVPCPSGPGQFWDPEQVTSVHAATRGHSTPRKN